MGYRLVGFLDDDEAKLGKKIGGVKVLGKLSEIKSWVKEKKVGDVVFQFLVKKDYGKKGLLLIF